MRHKRLKVNEQVPIDNIVPETTDKAYSQLDDDLFVCDRCGKPVTNKVKDYCLSNTHRFCGKIYCYDHQKVIDKNNN